ncbi:MAG TPA: hypothetical protein VMU49_02500 [Candidatus Acidoferrales bacterium]|nr:hypothetical protein [Candidatus Acidoferrales bacterium]
MRLIKPSRLWSRLLATCVYAIAMAFVEAAAVVYLRAIGKPLPSGSLIMPLPQLTRIESVREIATLVMLGSVAYLAAGRGWARSFWFFCLAFGVWDVFYYVFLYATIHWPPSLLTWDVLFLVPVAWTAPVLAPVLISCLLIVSAVLFLAQGEGGESATIRAASAVGGVCSALIVLASFMADPGIATEPAHLSYAWPLFAAGMLLAVVSLAASLVPALRGQ